MDGQAGESGLLECQLTSLDFMHSLSTSTSTSTGALEGDLVVVFPQGSGGPGVAG